MISSTKRHTRCSCRQLGDSRSYAFLSGPSFAREIAEGLATAVVVASEDRQIASDFRDVLKMPVSTADYYAWGHAPSGSPLSIEYTEEGAHVIGPGVRDLPSVYVCGRVDDGDELQ